MSWPYIVQCPRCQSVYVVYNLDSLSIACGSHRTSPPCEHPTALMPLSEEMLAAVESAYAIGGHDAVIAVALQLGGPAIPNSSLAWWI